MSIEKQCPKCKEGHLDERVHRSTAVKVFLFWLPIRRYMCYTCGRKSYVLYRGKHKAHHDLSQKLATE